MKLLLENWREYNRLNERINALDPDTGKRFVLDLLKEVSESDNIIQIPEEELAAIKEWGGLEGEPSFLGQGSRGKAYRFGDKVLKFTNDRRETEGAALLIGKPHPNVYDVIAAGSRTRENMERSTGTKQTAPYIIVYEFLDYPTNAMTDVAELLYYMIRRKDKQLFYNWENSSLKEAKELIAQFLQAIKEEPTLLGEPASASTNVRPKIKEISDAIGWGPREHKLFETMWTLLGGAYNPYLNSVEEAQEYTNKILNDPRLDYFHQLASGLTFLKENGIKFDDLKASNVMEKNGQAAIIDVGYSLIEGNPELPEIEQ
tara:strand:- start:1322 stop:2269 length:948 start_codon:yes stop_codon:yes gene_type:complete